MRPQLDTRSGIRSAMAIAMIVAVCVCSHGRIAAADSAFVGKTRIQRNAVDQTDTAGRPPERSGGTTLVVLGTLLASVVLLRRVIQARAGRSKGKSSNPVTLIGRHQLDAELTVRVIQVGPRMLIVGSTAQGIATLAEISDPAEMALLSGDESGPIRVSLFDGTTPVEQRASAASNPVPRPARQERQPSDASTMIAGGV